MVEHERNSMRVSDLIACPIEISRGIYQLKGEASTLFHLPSIYFIRGEYAAIIETGPASSAPYIIQGLCRLPKATSMIVWAQVSSLRIISVCRAPVKCIAKEARVWLFPYLQALLWGAPPGRRLQVEERRVVPIACKACPVLSYDRISFFAQSPVFPCGHIKKCDL